MTEALLPIAAAGLIVVPLAWATLAFAAGPRRGAWFAIVGAAAQAALALQLAAGVLQHGGHVQRIGGWGAPLGIDLVVDGLSAVMLLLTQVVALPLMLYARSYFAELSRREDAQGARDAAYHWPLSGLLLAAMNGMFLAGDLFNLYVTLELLGLAAVGLVAGGGEPERVRAALRYLMVNLVASGAYLLGVAIVYAAHGTVSIAVLVALGDAQVSPALTVALALMGLGLMAKTALVPFHFWLPAAHGSARAPVSALLSALVVKASFYLLLRLALDLFTLAQAASWLAGLLGTAAIVWGSAMALRTPRLKMLVAYSTVAQLGYLFLIFPLLGTDGLALQGGVLQAVAHGLAKAAMFACAGILLLATGHDRLEHLSGAVRQLPITVYAFGLAGVSLMGLPPSGGFLAKWLLIDAAISRGHWGWVVVVIGGGLLAAGYVYRVLNLAMRTDGAAAAPADPLHAVPRSMQWIALGLATASILVGLRGVELVQLLMIGRPA